MPSTIHAIRNDRFPKLGWCALLDFETDCIQVTHGSSVEGDTNWLVEGVWDGDFKKGDFHKSENFFGSGVRLDNGRVFFVPSSASVDRLFYCIDDDKLLVSNSLIILLSKTGAKLNSEHDYRLETKAIMDGSTYRKEFCVRHSTIECFYQVYCDNIVVSDREIRFEKRGNLREINSFQAYYETLRSVLDLLRDNYKDSARRSTFFPYSTLSTGYDSPAASCLVKEIGVTQCFSFAGTWSKKSRNDPRYNAKRIARTLNLSVIPLDSFHKLALSDELYIHASGPVGAQLPLLAMAAHIKRAGATAIVFTGYQGGIVWNANLAEPFLDCYYKRRDTSGIDLGELRLQCGFINVPVPFILAKNIRSIVAVSQQPEMDAWRLNNDYDRPIPRRILEQSGVERSHFGMQKGAIFNRYNRPIDPTLRTQYIAFLRSRYGFGTSSLYFRLIGDRISVQALYYLGLLCKVVGSDRLRRTLLKRKRAIGEGESFFRKGINLKALLFLWSVEVLTARLQEDIDCDPR